MAAHYSTPAWRIPGTGEPGGLSPWGHKESDTTERLHFHFSLSCTGRRKWQPTPAFLPGKSHGRRSLVGCSPRGRTESDTNEATQQQQQQQLPSPFCSNKRAAQRNEARPMRSGGRAWTAEGGPDLACLALCSATRGGKGFHSQPYPCFPNFSHLSTASVALLSYFLLSAR